MKKMFRMAAVLVLALLMFSACGASPSTVGPALPSSGMIPRPGQSSDAKIALIDFGGQQETDFGQAVWKAITHFAGEKGMGCNVYSANEDDFDPTLELAQKSGAEIVVLLGDEVAPLMERVQHNYPELYFLLLNTTQQWALPSNSASQQFLVEEAGWLSGYTAVTGGLRRLGVLTMDDGNFAQQRYALGFVLGADAAAVEQNLPEGEVQLYPIALVAGSSKIAISQQFNSFFRTGVEAVYLPAAGQANVEKMAQNAGVGLLLADTPAEDDTVLFSTQKNPQPVIESILSDWINGSFPTKEYIKSGLQEGAIRPAAGSLWADMATSQAYDDALLVFAKIRAGEMLDSMIAQPLAVGEMPHAKTLPLQRVHLVLPVTETTRSTASSEAAEPFSAASLEGEHP